MKFTILQTILLLFITDSLLQAETVDYKKNPQGLEYTAAKDTIQLTWKAPSDKIKIYRVYYRTEKEGFRFVGQTSDTSFKITGIKSDSVYFIRIISVDVDGFESSPKDELKVVTLNSLPDSPKNLTAEKKPEKSGTLSVKMKWDAAKNDDNVKKYNIYHKENDKYKQVKSTDKTETEIGNLEPGRTHYFSVSSVNNKNSESVDNPEAAIRHFFGYIASIQYLYIYPLGKFSDINRNGNGALLNLARENVLIKNLNIGLSAGYIGFKPGWIVENSFMIPVIADAIYKIDILNRLSILPHISLGYSYNKITVSDFTTGSSGSSLDPLLLAGAKIQYSLSELVLFNAGADYGIVFEKNTRFTFAAGTFSFGIRY